MTEIDAGLDRRVRPAKGPYVNAVYYLLALGLLTIPAFWPSYFSPPQVEADFHVHVHGVAMFLWMALLITQAFLMRAHRPLHRQLGKVSYVLAPVIVLSSLSLAHYRMQQGLSADLVYFFYLQICLLILFTVSYVQAMRHRKTPAVHARYMICTGLAILDPIVARLLYLYFGIDYPQMQVVTFTMIDGILLWLMLRDAKSGFQKPVFPAMLALFVATQIPTFFLYERPEWRAFMAWYAGLPIP